MNYLLLEVVNSTIKEQLRVSAHEIKRCLFIALLACVWMGIAPELYRLIPARATACMDWMYLQFDHNWLLNIPTCLILCFLYVKWLKRLFSYRRISYSCLFAIVFVYIILYYDSPFKYATIACGIDYRLFLSALLGIVPMLMAAKFILVFVFYISKCWNNPSMIMPRLREIGGNVLMKTGEISEKIFNVFFTVIVENPEKIMEKIKRDNKPAGTLTEAHRGFSLDNNPDILLSGSVKAYAETIVNKLKSTELKKESFAIGITSEWGAGKTTFLNLLKEEIQAGVSNDIVDFNPWMCQSPEQVTRDFFATLRNKLSERHPELSNPIKQYAKHLGSVSLPVFGIASISLNNFASEKNLLAMKEELSEKFSKLGKKVVVIIDDLDRLDSSEVFEVLRLIRNTADLSNMIYLVAYDKSYITKILADQHISDPGAYLEKIFQLEIQLPKVANEQVLETLVKELDSQLPDDTDISFIRDKKELIADILGTYRRAKRFARLFSLSYDYLSRNESLHKLVPREKFMLDLLQMDDKKIYDILWDKPEDILEKTDNGLWVYREEKTTGNGTEIKQTTAKLLEYLWPQSYDVPEQYSIRRIQNSMDYFTLGGQFSEKYVEQMVDATDPDTLVKEWKEKHKRLWYFADIIEAYYKKTKLKVSQKKNLICGILSANYYYGGYNEMITGALSNNVFIGKMDIIREWFNKKANEFEYSNYSYHYNKLYMLALVLEGLSKANDIDLKSIIFILIQSFVNSKNNKKEDCSILDIIYSDILEDNLGRLFIGFAIKNEEIVFESIIDFFSQRKPKPTMAKFEEATNKAIKDTSNSPLNKVFGEQWLEKVYEIREKCIEPDTMIEKPHET